VVRCCTPPAVEGMVRDEPEQWAALEKAGYQSGWSDLFWVFEGSLEAWKR
jgi:hypothetical protein